MDDPKSRSYVTWDKTWLDQVDDVGGWGVFVYNNQGQPKKESKMSDVQLPIEILKLSVDDRMELVTKIWESISRDSVTQPISDAHAHILDQRLTEADADPGALIPADEVFRELRDK